MQELKKQIILIVEGGHCRSCIDVIEQENKYEIAGIIDLKEKIGCDDNLPDITKKYSNFLIKIGQIESAQKRILIFKFINKLGEDFPVIISPRAYVALLSSVNEDSIIMHNAILNANVKIGFNNIINFTTLIEHDVIIGNHSHISTGSFINGASVIGDETFFGSGAVCIENVSIPNKSFIKANSLVK